MISCLTNPNCKKIEECENKVNCTTSNEQAEGLTRYVCGRVPCEQKSNIDLGMKAALMGVKAEIKRIITELERKGFDKPKGFSTLEGYVEDRLNELK